MPDRREILDLLAYYGALYLISSAVELVLGWHRRRRQRARRRRLRRTPHNLIGFISREAPRDDDHGDK